MKSIFRPTFFFAFFLASTTIASSQQTIINYQVTEVSEQNKAKVEKNIQIPVTDALQIKPTTIANETPSTDQAMATTDLTERERMLLERIEKLEKRLADLEARDAQANGREKPLFPNNTKTAIISHQETVSPPVKPSGQAVIAVSPQVNNQDQEASNFLRETTVNFTIDGYYAYNFNQPSNRVNLLRAYDVSSNSFSLNQAAVIIENAPSPEANRRFGFRLDLQYGQATETVQGNSNNEPRPQVYRPLWQAYGTYVAPLGKGLTVDFGKWAGSLGYETNYTKDNFNYSRSYFFNFLPFYHFGARVSYPVTKKLTATYWLVNGAQQSEDFNSSKSQAILLTFKPSEKIVLQGNYYVGREQRDQALADTTTPTTFEVTRGRLTPKGRFHALDAYGTFLLTDKLTFGLEADYVINRVNRRDTPSLVTGGAAYLRYQWNPKFAVAGRTEYLSDKGGLFSGTSQALKEITITGEYKFAEGFLVRGEYRRDWSNQPYFLTNDLNVLKQEQNTATLGLVWWFGRKTGAW